MKTEIYKTIILPVVLYGYETWSLTLRKERTLRVFESRIFRWIFGLKRDASEEWKGLHNEELHSLYRSPNIFRTTKSRRLGWAGHVDRLKVGKSAFKILTGTHTGKRLLWRSRRWWEDNIGMDLKEIGINTRNWVDSALDTDYWGDLVNAALNLRIP